MPKEIWKSIEGFIGLYEISSHGRVKSLQRITTRSNRFSSFSYMRKEKILKSTTGSNQYLKVTLVKEGNLFQKNIHRLVAEAFILNPKNKPQVNHKDGNKHNANVNNLEWVTSSENGIHAYKMMLASPHNKGKLGIKEVNQKHTRVVQIDKHNNKTIWDCASDAVRAVGADSGSITKCCQGKIKTHKGYIWEYI